MKVYVGWDSREDIAYQVCEHSIKRRDPSAEVYPYNRDFNHPDVIRVNNWQDIHKLVTGRK